MQYYCFYGVFATKLHKKDGLSRLFLIVMFYRITVVPFYKLLVLISLLPNARKL